MKQLKDSLKQALSFVGENENYIIFNDGKAVKTNLSDDISVIVNDTFIGNDYYQRKQTALENEIDNNVPFQSIITISSSLDLTIIHINDDEKYLSYSIIVNDNVQTNINNIYYKISNDVNLKLDILCKENSKVNIKCFSNFSGNIKAFVNAYCLKNAYIKLEDLLLNKKEAIFLSNVYLIDEDTKADLTNVSINSSGLVQTYKFNITHDNINTNSTIMNYGICKNSSYLTFDNNGIITKGSKKAEMSQKTKGIILDMYSSISANPILAIDENDVIANHGASIGAIDEEDLFYLMSRGLNQDESEKLIVEAFIAPYFDNIKESIKEYIFEETRKHL